MDGIDAVVLDVGGVLLLPEAGLLGAALRRAGIDHEDDELAMAHYGGVAALDAHPTTWPQGGAPAAYLAGLACAARVPVEQRDAAARALHEEVFTRPSDEVWRALTPWARTGLAALAAGTLEVAVVSNSDGTVEAVLGELGLAQRGPGAGLEVTVIVDSALVGAAKPDPAVFAPAIEALGVEPAACLYVGDTVTYDVAGAVAAGLSVVHLDPLGACRSSAHAHARDLPEAVPGRA